MKDRIINDEFINRIETLALSMRTTLTGYFGGNHKTTTYGQTVEFADFREYNLGDDIRRIDWNLYSRFEKYFIKLFVDERQMHNQIYIDCSSSMYKQNNEKAFFALKTAAAMGYLSVNNMDKATYYLLQNNTANDISGLITGKEAYYRAIAKLENTKFDGEVNIDKAIIQSTTVGSNNGLTVIISDFLTDDWKKSIDYLVYKKRDVLLIQVLSPEEINPNFNGRMSFLDSESKDILDDKNMRMKVTKSNLLAYQEALKDHINSIKIYCAKREVKFVSVNTSDSIEKMIFGNLGKVGSVK